jgi:hypothetical protein
MNKPVKASSRFRKWLLAAIAARAVEGFAENRMTDQEAAEAQVLFREGKVHRRLGDVGKTYGFIYYDLEVAEKV